MLDTGARGLVPSLWHLGMANGLVIATRRKDLSREDADKGLEFIEQMLVDAIESDADPVSVRHIFTSARLHQLSASDAVCLDLARRQGYRSRLSTNLLVQRRKQPAWNYFSNLRSSSAPTIGLGVFFPLL